ncbi:MAG: response regulator [bacterium]|nr:response regulator [bacterium]
MEKPSLQENQRPLHILLAEDNAVNQRLAVGLLENRSHRVRVASNGQEALDVLEAEHFDLVIMDVQMPDVDGFEATARIREREQITGGHVPIIAMTAYAMKGDQERCLASGMDAYVSKPVQAQELFRAIDTVLGQVVKEEPLRDAGGDQEVFNKDELLERVDGDEALFDELIGLFLEDCPTVLADIRAAVEQKDGEELERAAHRMKGMAGNFSAGPVVAVAHRLEGMGREGNLGSIEEEYKELKVEALRLIDALERVRTDTGGTK